MVGLGNPAPYEGTRHNAGFIFVDLLRRILNDQVCSCEISTYNRGRLIDNELSSSTTNPKRRLASWLTSSTSESGLEQVIADESKNPNILRSSRGGVVSSKIRPSKRTCCLYGSRFLMGLKDGWSLSCKDVESKYAEKFKGELSVCRVRGNSGEEREVLLLKPMTYMNLSGDSVLQVVQQFGIKPNDIVVVHDELDVNLGKVKYKLGGGDSGHNGLKSITGKIGTNYHRIRIGIGRPRVLKEGVPDGDFSRFAVDKWVLGRFTSWELGDLSCAEFFEWDCKAIRDRLEEFDLSLWTGMAGALKQFKMLGEQQWAYLS